MAAPYVPGENVAQVDIIGAVTGIPVMNTLYFHHSSGFDETELRLLCNDLAGRYYLGMAPLYPSSLVISQVYGTDLTTDTSPTAEADENVPITGTVVDGLLPLQDTLSISFRTAARGRSARGRNYWLAMTKDQCAGNFAQPAFAGAVLTAYQGFVGAGAVRTGWTWGVFSRRADGAWRTAGLFRPITSVVIPTRRLAHMEGRME